MTSRLRNWVLAFRSLCIGVAVLAISTPVMASEFIVLQSSTSANNAGLYDYLLPRYREQSGVEVRVVAVGTGQAIKNARNCDGDVLVTHDMAAERAFVADGFGVSRADLMYNDYILIGPQQDPAKLGQSKTALDAFRRIANSQARFASRGDDSGTHQAEVALWHAAGVNPMAHSGQWYLELGAGTGAALNIGITLDAYVLTDRASWLKFGAKRSHRVLFEGDPALRNQYGVVVVDQQACPMAKATQAEAFADWLLSTDTQQLIGDFRVSGQPVFFPSIAPLLTAP